MVGLAVLVAECSVLIGSSDWSTSFCCGEISSSVMELSEQQSGLPRRRKFLHSNRGLTVHHYNFRTVCIQCTFNMHVKHTQLEDKLLITLIRTALCMQVKKRVTVH